jgi:hypothetical protein
MGFRLQLYGYKFSLMHKPTTWIPRGGDDRQPLCAVPEKRSSAGCGGSEFPGGPAARADQGG